jgi:ribosome biogenesis protein MAK21
MAKSKNKKGPAFDESALEKLTSRIDDSLSKGDQQKRKKPHTTEVSSQDRKRQRKSSDGASKQGKASSNENELLLAEIRALGGDEDDFDLIQNAESEDEVVGQDDKKHPIDRGLKAELAKLSKELGFAEYEPSEASEPEAEEEEEEGEDIDDGDEDGSDFDDEDVDEEEPKAVESKANGKEKPEAQTKQQARKIGNLVRS